MPDRAADAALLCRFETWRARVDAALDHALAAQTGGSAKLQAAMRHAALLGGKRIRPLLVYATGAAFGADLEALDAPAAAVELMHAYSLVHDDLPAMDDDALRRGQPTVHIAFDEATAILAGDALQSLAIELLADAPLAAEARIAMVHELAVASGARGMCGGQALDLEATGSVREKWGQSEVSRDGLPAQYLHGREIHSDPISPHPISPADLNHLHALKTGALLRAAVRLGAIAAGADRTQRAMLDRYADALGLAFQIRDDLLDIESDSATLGKTAGKDVAQAKATFPAVLGIEASHARLDQLAKDMDEALIGLGVQAAALHALGRRAIERRH